MKDIYLDDERPCPNGWHLCRHVYEAIAIIKTGQARKLSLDFDMGKGEKNGMALVLWMVENNKWPIEKPYIHSANPPGAEAMKYMIDKWFKKPYIKQSWEK